MHKSKLQELCHKRMWDFPSYKTSREGPDHNPLFCASVVVNGELFEAPKLAKSVKEAHNKAAEVALERLSAIPMASASATPDPDHSDGADPILVAAAQISYKSQLQQYMQKRDLGVPKYISVHEGVAHALQFKAKVTVDGQTFESPQYFSTLREAEHSAAKVALMSLPHEENHQDEPKFYKIVLHQLVQKEGLSLPIYNTLCDGECHMPLFRSTVVLDGESFVGDAARTKKQAEMNAAKIALNHFKGRINAHSMKVTSGEAIDNLEQPKIHIVQPSSLKAEKRSQTAEGNEACLANVIQPATGLSPKCQVIHDDSPISFRNQLVGVAVMDQPYLTSIQTSTLKIKEDLQAKGRNEACLANVIQPATGLSPKCQVIHDDSPISFRNQLVGVAVMDQPYLTSIQTSTLKIKEDLQAKGNTNVLEQQKNLSVRISNVKIKEEKQANGKVDERVVENKSYGEVLTDATMIKNEPVDGILPFDYTKIDLFNLKLDSSGSSAKDLTAVNNSHNGQIVNQHHDEIFSSDHVDQLSLSVSKLGFDGKTKQEECKVVSSPDIDTKAFEETIADVSKVADLPFMLCNRVSVYPRKPGVVLPDGATFIPFSDGAWVAVSLDFSEREDNLPNIL